MDLDATRWTRNFTQCLAVLTQSPVVCKFAKDLILSGPTPRTYSEVRLQGKVIMTPELNLCTLRQILLTLPHVVSLSIENVYWNSCVHMAPQQCLAGFTPRAMSTVDFTAVTAISRGAACMEATHIASSIDALSIRNLHVSRKDKVSLPAITVKQLSLCAPTQQLHMPLRDYVPCYGPNTIEALELIDMDTPDAWNAAQLMKSHRESLTKVMMCFDKEVRGEFCKKGGRCPD